MQDELEEIPENVRIMREKIARENEERREKKRIKRKNEYERWLEDNPEKRFLTHRKYYLKKQYGLTLDEYTEMLEAQDGKCAICGSNDPLTKYGVWSVDHNHFTGKVCGLLCARCNSCLPAVEDNPDWGVLAKRYLEKYP